MIVLRPRNLRWVDGCTDEASDLCAHGEVEFRIGDDSLVSAADGEITVSAAALYLLRTLSTPHTVAAPVGDHLFPCCGFTLIHPPGSEDVLILGCLSGRDVEVEHRGSGHVVIRDEDRSWKSTWTPGDPRFSILPTALPRSICTVLPSSLPTVMPPDSPHSCGNTARS